MSKRKYGDDSSSHFTEGVSDDYYEFLYEYSESLLNLTSNSESLVPSENLDDSPPKPNDQLLMYNMI